MSRPTIRIPVQALLTGLLLAACGGLPDTEPAPSPGEALGIQEAALCSGPSVNHVAINGLSSYQGELAGSGSWAASGGANAVRLEYRVDGTLRSSEERTGASGTWYFSAAGTTCGSHTFQVKAWPMVIDSAGNRTTCWDNVRSASQAVTQACPTASLSCTRSSTTITCTGSGSGSGGYTPFWQQDDDGSVGPWYQSGWTGSFFCPMSKKPYPYLLGTMAIHFKVRDSSGMESAVVTRSYACTSDS